MDDMLDEYREHKDVKVVAEPLRDLKVPERFFGDVLAAIFNKAMDRDGSRKICKIFACS